MGDITSVLTIPEDKKARARVISKEACVIAGLPFAREAFAQIDPEVEFKPLVEDGEKAKKGDVIAHVRGKARSLLAGERLALNILQHLSGIATLTSQYAQKLKGTKAKIVDTRKTLPNLRYMEKYAVRAGGGANHRFALYDAILIKDNHIKAAGGVKKAIRLAKGQMHLMKVEIEVKDIGEFKAALEEGADVIMLDNMGLREMRECVRLNRGRALIEASGNVTMERVREIAATGVDIISAGALTHSAPAADISMKIE